jgi:hypothetical protein
MNNCLDCKWLEEPGERHVWHQCVWPVLLNVPRAVSVIRSAVNVEAPFRDCPAWEAVTPSGPAHAASSAA